MILKELKKQIPMTYILFRKLSIIGFSDDTVKFFQSCLANWKFFINLENSFTEILSIICGVTQRYILVRFLFLIYVKDILMEGKCNLFFYIDDTCLVFRSGYVKGIKNQLNEDLAYICNWFVGNKLSIHFGDDKAKSILLLQIVRSKRFQS